MPKSEGKKVALRAPLPYAGLLLIAFSGNIEHLAEMSGNGAFDRRTKRADVDGLVGLPGNI